MTTWAEELLYLVRELPREDQLRIAEALRKEDEEPPPALSEEWKAELRRRLKTLEDGTAVLLDGETHMRRLFEKFGA